jgi:hypothetical protein
MAWTKLPALPGQSNPCLCCPPIPAKAAMDKGIAVGFGSATVERDDVVVIDGERQWQKTGDCPTFADAEALAVADPDHDWRVVLHGPLHGETYQRQGPGEWVLVDKNEGFA